VENYGLVSIIMPSYNAERYVKDSIESVLKQTYSNFEFIIVNDGSKDRTLEIAKSYKDERIKIIDLKENRGVSHARNVALDVAKGDWIAFNAADDVWKPERLEYLLGIITRYEYGKYFIADDLTLSYEANSGKLVEYGSELHIWFPEIYRKYGANDVIEVDYKDFFYIAFQPILPSKAIKENGLKFPENLNFAEDLYFYAKLFKRGLKMLITKKSFYFYRIAPGSLTDLELSELVNKIEKFERTLEDDAEFNVEDKELFKKYFEVIIRNAEKSNLKNSLLRGGFKNLIFAFLKHPYPFLKYLFVNLSNPYKIFSYLRLGIQARREGGIKRRKI
jgi:succinoglycan biosynthesis protein ExoO